MLFTANSRNISVIAMSLSMPSLPMACSFSRSCSLLMSTTSELTLRQISADISGGCTSPDEFAEDSSFIFDNMQREDPQRSLEEYKGLHAELQLRLKANFTEYS